MSQVSILKSASQQTDSVSSVESHYALEVPASITVNGIAHAVMMVTPHQLEAFAVGFALSEGIIERLEDVRDLNIHSQQQLLLDDPHAPVFNSVLINLHISPRRWQQYRSKRQQRLGTSGCGLCGHESLKSAMPQLSPLSPCDLPPAEQLLNLHSALDVAQTESNVDYMTGNHGLHMALLRSPSGEVVTIQQDIGRHNALDKVIGFALQNGIQLFGCSVLISSRSSVELVQKSVRAGLSTLIHLGTPSSLAIQLARYYGLNLLRATRDGGIQIFSEPQSRI